MKATEQYFLVVLIIRLYTTLRLATEILRLQASTATFFLVTQFIMLCKVVLTFKSLNCGHLEVLCGLFSVFRLVFFVFHL